MIEETPPNDRIKSVPSPSAQNGKGLPEHWQLKKLGEVGQIVSGGTPSTTIEDYWNGGEIAWISPADLSKYSGKYISKGKKSITEKGLKNSSARLIPKSSVLFSSRAPIGYTVIAANDVSTNQGFKSVIPNETLSSDFLYYYLKSAKQMAENAANGTTFKEISLKAFSQLTIPIPPLPEQQAIVAKIEELLSELENGKQQLLTAQQQLKVYRQSLLKWAFEGNDYPLSNMVDLNIKIQIGPFGTQLHKEDYIENGIPLINPMHIQNGKIVPNYSYSIRNEKMQNLPNYILKEGDVIMGRRGEMGRCGLVSKTEDGWFCGTGSLYFRPNPKKLNSRFLYYYLSSQPIKKYLELNAGGTTMANLNLKIVREIPIKLPEIKEQEQIVNELESKLTVCDKIEETISKSFQQAETLMQSILKKAFEGRLVTAVEQREAKVIQLLIEEFPRKISGISATDLQAGIISMVIDLHQNNPKHIEKLNHVKCEKIADLVERKLGISLGRVAMKDAAGPDDFNHLKKVEHRANMAGFFKPVSLQPIGQTYQPMRNMQKAIDKVKTALSEAEFKQIDDLLKVFLPFELEHAELVATLFAGWNNLLLLGKSPNDEEIVFESRENWSKRKLAIPRENFFKTLNWMKQHDFIPKGKGQLVLKKEETKKATSKKA